MNILRFEIYFNTLPITLRSTDYQIDSACTGTSVGYESHSCTRLGL